MMMDKRLLSLLVILAAAVAGDSCPELPNHIQGLPGFNDTDVICNYAGYSLGSPYFYWFLVKTNYTRLMDIPLLVYLGSGTESALMRLFQPGGPYRLVNSNGEYSIKITESLLDVANILYIEQPGLYSFSREKFTGEYTVYVFLQEIQRFLDSFVQRNGFTGSTHVYIIAEGYMAKVGAMLALPQAGPLKYRVRGLIINNGIYDLSTQTAGMANLAGELAVIPQDLLDRLREETYVSRHRLRTAPQEAVGRWKTLGDTLKEVSGLPNFLDSVSDTTPGDQAADVEKYLSQQNVQRALGIRSYAVWERHPKAPAFRRALAAILNISTPEFNILLDNSFNLDVMFNVGAFSPLTCVEGFEQWVKSAKWRGKDDLFLLDRMFVTRENGMAYVKEREQLIYAIHPDDGQVLGSRSPSLYMSSMMQFIKNRTLHGLVEDDSALPAILNQCSSNGQYNGTAGQCVCGRTQRGERFYGADCSVAPDEIDSFPLEVELGPDQWGYYYIEIPLSPISLNLICLNCDPDSELLMALNGGDPTTLPNEFINDAFSSTRRVVVEPSPGKRAVLGVKVRGQRKGRCRVRVESEPLESKGLALVVAVLVGVLLVLLGLTAAFCVAWYLLRRRQTGQLRQLKV